MAGRHDPDLVAEHNSNNNQVVKYPEHEEKLTAISSENPLQVIHNARAIADELKKIIKNANLTQRIGTKDYVKIEGWTSMLAMLGVSPITVSNTRLDREDEVIYEAAVELRTRDGHLVGRGEAICSHKERNWSNRDEYAIKSMAATRATGKAARLSFSWIMTLAGYDPTPLEEMPFTEANEVKEGANTTTITKPEPKAEPGSVYESLLAAIANVETAKQKAQVAKEINEAEKNSKIDVSQKQSLFNKLNERK
jgi:hypothetical protein